MCKLASTSASERSGRTAVRATFCGRVDEIVSADVPAGLHFSLSERSGRTAVRATFGGRVDEIVSAGFLKISTFYL
ncbi:unnamed protein product [Sphagnum troendelagicum]|uniref:Uncharacterized protein n=1 Tax=Sphagnum troendelagicum TaxID=128251 RepID=A0ABP0UVY9_9BRYO